MAKHIAKYINCEFSAKNYLQKLKYNMHKDWKGLRRKIFRTEGSVPLQGFGDRGLDCDHLKFISQAPTWLIPRYMLTILAFPYKPWMCVRFRYQDTRPRRNPGELDALWRVSLASEAEVLTALAKVLSGTCVEAGICLLPPRPGVGGIGKSLWPKSAMPCALPSPPLEFPLSSWPKVISQVLLFSTSTLYLNFCLSLWWVPHSTPKHHRRRDNVT